MQVVRHKGLRSGERPGPSTKMTSSQTAGIDDTLLLGVAGQGASLGYLAIEGGDRDGRATRETVTTASL